jgi:glycosyltransferase 2 family protein
VTTAYTPDTDPVESTSVRRRPQALALTSVVLSAGLVVLSIVLVDARQVLARLEAADPRWLVAFFAVYVVQIVLLGLRWSTISRAVGVPLSWRRASAEYALSILVNQLLPTGIAGDGLRAVRHARRAVGHSFARIVEALALDRVSGQLALILIALVSAPWTIEHGLIRAKTFWLAGALLSAALMVLMYAAWTAPRGGGLAARAGGFFRRAAAALVEPRRAAVHLTISLLMIGTCLAQLGFAARAIGLDLDLELLFWLGPLILLAASVPSFFGGWGIREGASAILFGSIGMGSSAGVALSLVFGAFALVCALPGFIVLLFEDQFSKRLRARAGAEVSWGNAHAVAMLGGTAMALALHIPALVTFVGVLSVLFFVATARGNWTPSGRFGLANGVTTLRMLLTLVLLVGVDHQPGYVPAVLALCILGLDLVDGWLARRYGTESPFGACYDMEADAVFVLSLSCMLWARGVAGLWVVLAGLWRYLFVVIPLVVPSRGGEAPRSIYYRSAYAVMVLSFVLSLVVPPALGRTLAALGTLVLSVSFLRSFYYRYSPPDAARGA